jgi:Cdc6-like AAA superfamily ATPase
MADSIEYPRFISNAPCGEDLFEGGAHDKLAKVIADTIRTDSKCTIIGIDGGWGSGKSNLVELIGKKLNDAEENKYHIFIYDAWGHQTDYPKRSILEELISSLVNDKDAILSNSSYWKQKLKDLLSKRREVSKQVVPNLSVSSIVILIMIFSTPYLTIFSNNFKESCLGWIIPSLFYIVCALCAYCAAKKELKRSSVDQNYRLRTLLNYLIKIYQNEAKSDTTYEQISEREPSSAQFKNWMNELNTSIANEHKTLIVVFDNMDRLPKAKVQELWSAIHSFFSEVKYSNIKTIVPFDREHIKGAFKSEDIEIQPNKENCSQNIISFGDDFINKTFYVVYPVAPPILTGWKSYFREQWHAAMGKDYILDSTVLQIYDILTSNQTPRKIIAFINDFVSIKKVADPEIHDKYIALYIFGRESIRKDPLKQILAPGYLGALDFLYKNDTQMQECISSLHYQLPLENALDVVYVSKAIKGLDNNDTDFMAILKNSPKAIAILNHSITDVVNIKNAVIALEGVLKDLPRSQDLQNLWDALYLKAINSDNWISTFEDFHCGFVSHVTEKEKLFNYIVEHYQNNIGETFTIESYVKAIDSLKASDSAPIEFDREFNITPADFIKLISIKEDTYPFYGVWVDGNQLDEYLSELDVEKINGIECLRTLRKDFNLPVLRKKLKSYASDNATHRDVLETLFSKPSANPVLTVLDYL